MDTLEEIRITRRKLRAISSDGKKTAKAVNLVYVTDSQQGIERIREKDGFSYYYKGEKVTDEETIFRIKRLVLPPAWESVWICTKANGHLQATGIDAKGRKQYKYHPLWASLRNQTKFFNLHDFGVALPAIRERIAKDLARPGLGEKKVLATVISLMQCTCIRIGNSAYEKLYGSFGLTTLKDKHVSISGQEVKFSFKGKKGVSHKITMKNRKLAKIVQQCRDIPGKELFQYYDENGERHTIDSGMVNAYIKEISGGNFTAKDFRTWSGSLYAIQAFKELGAAATQTAAKRNVVTALDMVAKQLGNTRSVCKKYYVHPNIIELYTNNSLIRFLRKADKMECTADATLSIEERVLMNILEKGGTTRIAA